MHDAWRRRLATAHLCLSWLSFLAAIVSIFTLATRPLGYGLETLAVPAHAAKIAAVACLLSTCTVQLWIARSLRHRAELAAPHGWLPIAFSSAVLLALLSVVLRGAHSRALLAGGDLVLAAVATVTALSWFLAVAGWFLSRREGIPLRSSRRRNPFQQAVWLLHCAACLLLVAALAVLELRPLPHGDRAAQDARLEAPDRHPGENVGQGSPWRGGRLAVVRSLHTNVSAEPI